MKDAVTAILLDTRRRKNDGTFPVKLRITFQRKQRYFTTKYSFTEEEYNKIQGEKPRGEFKNYKLELQALEQKAIAIVKEMSEFSFPVFEKRLLTRPSSQNDIFLAHQSYYESLVKEERIKTAVGFISSFKSLKSFYGKDKLPFEEVSVNFLKSYEKWMLDNGHSISTVGIYLRNVRTLFNIAIAEGIIKEDIYPFGKRRYQIPSSRNVKKAISRADVIKIVAYEARHPDEARARDLWIFSYLLNGINVKDIARLKYKNITEETVTFFRAKTLRTSRKNLKPIVGVLTPPITAIIEKWGNKPVLPNIHVFPILDGTETPEEESRKINNLIRSMNHYMEFIGKKLGIGKKITTYTARHSHSTHLIKMGAPMHVLSENLGHEKSETTQLYVDKLDINIKKRYINHLSDFENLLDEQ